MADSPDTVSPAAAAGRDHPTEAAGGVRCDFCQAVVPSVRRVALDGEYERLRTRHNERYACPACSERKEQERLGLSRD
jgi:hypothetical protein